MSYQKCNFCLKPSEMEKEYPDDPHHGAMIYCDHCDAQYYQEYEQEVVNCNEVAKLNHPELKNL